MELLIPKQNFVVIGFYIQIAWEAHHVLGDRPLSSNVS